MRWFAVYTSSRHEKSAANHFADRKIETFLPLYRKTYRWPKRSAVTLELPLFPNYLFARFCLQKLIETVRYTPSVKGLVQFGEHVPPIPDFVIEDLRRSLREDELISFTDQPLEGEEAEISAGPFEGEKGVVTRVLPAKQRVQVLLDIMGRSIPAEFSLDAILFKRRNAADFVLAGTAALSNAGMVKQILEGEGLGSDVVEPRSAF